MSTDRVAECCNQNCDKTFYLPRSVMAVGRQCSDCRKLNSFQRESIYRLWCIGIIAKPLANWITFETPDGVSHTIMSEQGIDEIVDAWES